MPKPAGYTKLTPEMKKRIIHLYSVDKLTLTVIGKRFGLSMDTVRRFLIMEGIHKPAYTRTKK